VLHKRTTHAATVLVPGADAESLTSVYGISYDNSSETTVGVYLYSGSGTNWTFIGAPWSPVLAAED
jgi:hypothetical protein